MPELEKCFPAFSAGRRGILQVEIFLSKTMVFHFVKMHQENESCKKSVKEKILDSVICKDLYD